MELREARVFIAVAEELSFTRAGDRLALGTPSVSETIKLLERHYGRRLFDRDPRSVELTAFGQALLPAARALLCAHDELEQLAERLSGAHQITIGTLYGLGARLMRQVVAQHSAQEPLLAVARVYDWTEPSCGLRTDEVDIAVLVGPTSADHQIHRVPLGTIARLALLPEGALPAHRDTVSLAEVDAVGWIPIEASDQVWDRAWRLDDVRGGAPPLNGPAQATIEGMVEGIRAGVGATITIEAFTQLYAPVGMAYARVSDVPPLQVDLACRADRAQPPLSALLELARERFAPGQWY